MKTPAKFSPEGGAMDHVKLDPRWYIGVSCIPQPLQDQKKRAAPLHGSGARLDLQGRRWRPVQ